LTLDRLDPVDKQGIDDSVLAVEKLIDRELERGIDSQRIVLAGFSQGGVIALHTALQYPKTLAGIAALSTYLPLAETLSHKHNPANADIPIFMAHGLADPVLSLDLGRRSHDMLVEFHPNTEWHEYPMAHAVCPDEIVDLSEWLQTKAIG